MNTSIDQTVSILSREKDSDSHVKFNPRQLSRGSCSKQMLITCLVTVVLACLAAAYAQLKLLAGTVFVGCALIVLQSRKTEPETKSEVPNVNLKTRIIDKLQKERLVSQERRFFFKLSQILYKLTNSTTTDDPKVRFATDQWNKIYDIFEAIVKINQERFGKRKFEQEHREALENHWKNLQLVVIKEPKQADETTINFLKSISILIRAETQRETAE